MSKSSRYLVGMLAVLYVVSAGYFYRALSDNIDSQVTNRAKNVQAWCGGINAGRDYNRAFVQKVSHGRLTYTLPDLPCKALVAKTLKSVQH